LTVYQEHNSHRYAFVVTQGGKPLGRSLPIFRTEPAAQAKALAVANLVTQELRQLGREVSNL
jgi:hypothetical protein